MSADLNNASEQFVAFYNDKPIAFCASLHFPHSRVKNFKRLHRLVVLPDYQGLKIGSTLSDFVCHYLKRKGNRVIVTTSNPVTIKHRLESKKWIVTRKGHTSLHPHKSTIKNMNRSVSNKKITISLEYLG